MDELDNKVVEVERIETKIEESADKLSNRDALEQAISEKRVAPRELEDRSKEESPTKTEVKAAVEADIEPPAEFSAAAKKAWKDKDFVTVQKEYSRLHNARTQEMTRAQTSERQAREDAKTWRALGDMAAPYIEARGAEGVTPQKAMMEALALINELKKADPATTKAELKKIGIDLDAQPTSQVKVDDTKKDALQERLDRLERIEGEREFERTAQTFGAIFDSLTSLKTRTGETVFPDLLDSSPTGIQFAKELGSLTQDAKFQQGVLRRFPQADLTVLVREAYKYLGGKVSGEPVTVSASNNQKHIEKSRRAAASAPQGSTMRSRSDSSSLIGKLSSRAALQKALEEQQEH